MNNLTDRFELKNGVGIPCIGFGTWQVPSGETTVESIKTAISAPEAGQSFLFINRIEEGMA